MRFLLVLAFLTSAIFASGSKEFLSLTQIVVSNKLVA
ncbi:Uncharacterised protein [Campylobacter upsaliensis]|nr:Uncharacterised protein [Campylobacter upsaliensis]